MLLRDVYRVMDPENSAGEKEEVKDKIWAMLIFKGCFFKKNPRERYRRAGRWSIKCGGRLNWSLGVFLAPTI